uniref:Uncharacterized protein n=1 Tax=Anguilla anguilla TaxID=7936 RepID=A0A0E9WC92_ANGAN
MPLYQRRRNSAPIFRAPVPPRHCTPPTLFCWMAGLSSPRAILEALERNSGSPRIGRCSWFRVWSSTIILSTFFTTGNTHGWLSSVL